MRNCPATVINLSLLTILIATGCSLADRLGEDDPESGNGDTNPFENSGHI